MFRLISQQLNLYRNPVFLIIYEYASPSGITGILFSTFKKCNYLLNNDEKKIVNYMHVTVLFLHYFAMSVDTKLCHFMT